MKIHQLLLVAGMLGAAWLPALAQTTPAGPVHVPPGFSTNTPATAAPLLPAPAAILPGAPSATTASAPSADDDIHDIRGPLTIPTPLLWLVEVAAASAALALGYAAWRYFRRAAAARAKLPHEIALERLEAARALMTEGQVREYAFAVSEVVRIYIEKRFGEKAARRTTEEFISDLLRQTGTPLAQHRALLEDFLHHCDLPKFARWQLSVREMESMHDSARAFILDTEPNAASASAAVIPPQPVRAR